MIRILSSLFLLLISGTVLADDDVRGRFLKEFDSSQDVSIAAFAFRTEPLLGFGQPKIEIAAGMLDGDTERRGFASVGPVWQRSSYERFGMLIREFSFAPTILTSGKFENRDLGGVLQFTTGLAIGWKPAPQSQLYLGLRVQHISNGSLHRRNPGMDAVGIELLWSSK